MRTFLVSLLSALALTAGASARTEGHFESPQTHPLTLTPSGSLLLAVDTTSSRLSVFDRTHPDLPVLVREIRVGLEPVSVAARDDDEAWVVNHVSDSVSVVSLSQGVVVATIPAGDEPCDIVFAGSPPRAFVSSSRDNRVVVIDPATRAQVATIGLEGNHPRALAASEDGSRVYVAFALSGNRTTAVPKEQAPPQPPPTNPALPPPPQVALIADAEDPAFAAAIPYDVLDHDVAEIDTATLAVTRYFDRAGTVNLGIAVRPGTGELFVSNTDARNLVRFEPELRGHVVDNRVTRIDTGANPTVTPFDLNPGIDYSVLPNPAARAIALSQPADLVFHPSGTHFYVAAFGSDKVARVTPGGFVTQRISLGDGLPGQPDPRDMRGPRGLALAASDERLYVQNRISDTISVIDTQAGSVIAEVPLSSHSWLSTAVREGRGFLYDARLSGNGTASCASCHVDGEDDKLAWDLGDPGGVMQTVIDPDTENAFPVHPMKGPMVTQPMLGLAGTEPFHWRGDRQDLSAFNPAFDSLLGGSPLADDDMQLFEEFVDSVVLEPNPFLELDRSFPPSIDGGDPAQGLVDFQDPSATPGPNACASCHSLPNQFQPKIRIQSPGDQPMDVPFMRGYYRKFAFRRQPGFDNVIGFGLEHDGTVAPVDPPGPGISDLTAFFLAFDSGTAPMVGAMRTISSANPPTPALVGDLLTMQARAAAGDGDLIAFGDWFGEIRGFVYDPASDRYLPDRAQDAPLPLAVLLAAASSGDATLTFLGALPGQGVRMGIDRDEDAVLDGDEIAPSVVAYGAGCPGTGSVTPSLQVDGIPVGGAGMAIRLDDARPFTVAALLFGTGQSSAPVSPSCSLDILPLVQGVTVLLAVPASGELGFAAQIPDPVPPGVLLTMQGLVADAGAAGGIAATNAVALRFD